jgi:hypothetical protein
LWQYPDDGDLVIDNCVQAGGGLVGLWYRPLSKTASPHVSVAHGTVRAQAVLTMFVDPGKVAPVKADAGGLISLAVSESVIDVIEPLRLELGQPAGREQTQLVERIESVLPQLLAWRDRQNLYAEDNLASFVTLHTNKPIYPPSLRTWAGWDKTWGQSKTGSSRGQVRYQGGGDPFAGQVTPEDFRLRSDSAGYRAGPDGKDLGADVDLVGPGAAYERWKKTPEYQQWLEETGQADKPE